MAVHLSPIGNGFQFLDNVGAPLNAGLLYTYQTNSTTPEPTFTTSTGNVQNANPVVLGVSGRPPQEIWLTDGTAYTFVLKDSLFNVLGTYDNLSGINNVSASGVMYTAPITGAGERTLVSRLGERLSINDFRNDDGTQVGASLGVQDDTTGIQRALDSLSRGDAIYVPPTGTSFYKVTDTIIIPKLDGIVIYGAGIEASEIRLVTNVANTDLFDTNNIYATATQGIAILDLFLRGSGTGTRYGLLFKATGHSRLRLRIEGFNNTNGAGIFIADCIIVDAYLDLVSNYYGILDTGGLNANINAWTFNLCLESNAYAGSIYGTFGSDFLFRVNEGNSVGGLSINTAGGGLRFMGYLGEGNAQYDLQIGGASYINGVSIQGYFDTGTEYAIQIKFATGLRTGPCYMANRTKFVEFLSGGSVVNSVFGLLTLGPGTSPIRDPSNSNVTYKGIDASILQRGNYFEDYNTFPCTDSNLIQGDFPYGGWTFTQVSGTPTFLRSPNTGATPDVYAGRPVGLVTLAGTETATIAQSWTISGVLNPGVRNAWVTFDLMVFFNSASQIQFTQTLDDTGTQVAFSVQSGTNAVSPTRMFVSGYFSSGTTALRALLNAFTNPGSFKLGAARVCVGMDPRRFPAMIGPPIFTGASAIPSAGTYVIGDRVVRTPVVGQPQAWSNTAAGSPGTMTSEGNL